MASAHSVDDLVGQVDDTLNLTQVGDLMSEPDEAVPWLVDNRIAKSTVSAIAGPPKSGKSSLLRQLALAVAGGTRWLGNECNQHAVVFLSVEDNRRQATAHFRHMEADAGAPLHVHTGPPPDPELISTDEWVERLIDRYDAKLLVVENFAKLLVVENFAKLVSVDDWNDYGTVTAALRPYDAIASVTGCAIIIGLHVRKSALRKLADGLARAVSHGLEVMSSSGPKNVAACITNSVPSLAFGVAEFGIAHLVAPCRSMALNCAPSLILASAALSRKTSMARAARIASGSAF